MNVLAINCGSSSVKYMLYSWESKCVLAKGMAERIGLDGAYITHKIGEKSYPYELTLETHGQALEFVFKLLHDEEIGVVKSLDEISVVGHRVTHGGEDFKNSVLIDEEVVKIIEKLSLLAPLHNPPNLAGINFATEALPNAKQVAIFDTAFHQTIPDYAFMYALPYNLYCDMSIRRYGFHGTSHLYISKRAAAMLNKASDKCNIISLHIGNGASATAIKGGKSVDTSMGFTPLEGLMMGTRAGDIDPAIPQYLEQTLGIDWHGISNILNKQSGILGITGKYADRRDVMREAENGNERAQLAIEMECYRIKKYVGMYYATLGRVDAIVFTAGVGENAPLIREKALEGLEDMGIILDKEKNNKAYSSGGECVISTAESKVKVMVIPTDEEQVFIEDSVALIQHGSLKKYKYTFEQ